MVNAGLQGRLELAGFFCFGVEGWGGGNGRTPKPRTRTARPPTGKFTVNYGFSSSSIVVERGRAARSRPISFIIRT